MDDPRCSSPSRSAYAALLLLSLSALIFEINLTRLFSVAQFYQFAFMIVSLALLGSGASGTFLTIFPRLGRAHPQKSLFWLAVLSGLAMWSGYLLINGLPFDSFSIALDRKQVAILSLHYIALSLPFFFSRMATSLFLEVYPLRRGQIYAVNLVGSALGCVAPLALPGLLGGEGMLLVSGGISALTGFISVFPRQTPIRSFPRVGRFHRILQTLVAALLLLVLVFIGWRTNILPASQFLGLRISPYKSLSYALQYPGVQMISTRWNTFSRVDRVTSPGIRSFPGMSYLYMQPLPPEDAIFTDGDDLSPVVRPGSSMDFAGYMPSAVAFELRPGAETLVLEPRGGLDILIAQHLGAARVIAVEENPLVIESAGPVYHAPGVTVIAESGRSYLQRTTRTFDVVVISLTSAYHPVQSGAYCLAEDYRYTVESFQEALRRLDSQGLLVVTRWLQTPPSEELRAFATGMTAIEQVGGDPQAQMVAFRGYNMLTLLLKRSPFTPTELQAIRRFAADRAYDLVYAPDIRPEEANQFNILPEPVYYQSFKRLFESQPRTAFYENYPYNVSPPTDDHPFFSHFFKWSQAGQVLAELGHTWQPFGGAGYFVILALLAVALVSSGFLILLPVALARKKPAYHVNLDVVSERRIFLNSRLPSRFSFAFPVYFALIGFAYLLVEMPLIQRFILFLGQPAYALAVVLFTLLLFSGLGSWWSHKIPLRISLVVLAVLLLALPLLLPPIFRITLGLSLPLRLVLTVLLLSPVGFLMGVPFPAGLRYFLKEEEHTPRLAWVWSINGAASVIAALLAALLALSFGFGWVLRIGAFCYAGAWLMAAGFHRPPLAGSLRR